ncbi:hypothetical protein PLICRDRAFT_96703 [Plicaturopsis crispa FD-325 SS-3]|nr:hypothetical protein PLICRDRAFT_96703 [Plicaturopsis crispa FD-325 SS-3]
MLSSFAARPARLARPHHACSSLALRRRTTRPQRTFVTSAVQALTEGFLDLSIALPYPVSWPAYSSTIIVVTIATRLALTLPFSIWALKRRWRAEEIVQPRLAQLRPTFIEQAVKEMRAKGATGTRDELNTALEKRVKQLLTLRSKELYKEQSCTPTPTALIPVVVQAPLFLLFSWVYREAAQIPTPLDSESFLSLTSLNHVDPTGFLPIALGIITLVNVESATWYMSPAEAERRAQVQEWVRARRLRGEIVWQPMKTVRPVIRGLSVVRIIVAATVPGSVAIYWVTSAAFGLLQTWVFDYIHARRRRRIPLVPISRPPPPGPKVPQNTQAKLTLRKRN